MDNIIIVPEEYQTGLNNISEAINCLNDILTKLRNIESISSELGISIFEIESKTKIIDDELKELYSKLNSVNNEVVDLDSSASKLFGIADRSTSTNNKEETDEEKLDRLKGSNKATGALISSNILNILGELKNPSKVSKLIDGIKLLNGNSNCNKSSNTSGIMNTNEGVNLILDSIKNTGEDGSNVSMNAVSILNKEM